jgi:hypothetical protein
MMDVTKRIVHLVTTTTTLLMLLLPLLTCFLFLLSTEALLSLLNTLLDLTTTLTTGIPTHHLQKGLLMVAMVDGRLVGFVLSVVVNEFGVTPCISLFF